MVARVIIRIAGQDVVDQTGKQFPQRCGRIREFMTDNFGKILIAGIAGHHFIQTQKRERGNHAFALPAL